jgi:hypothetical protein
MDHLTLLKDIAGRKLLRYFYRSVVIIAVLIHEDDDGRSKSAYYVPKSQQTWWHRTRIRVGRTVTTLLEGGLARLEAMVGSLPRRRRPPKARGRRRGGARKCWVLTAYGVLALQAWKIPTERTVVFDTDSAPVGIDSRCSACISPFESDFVGPLQDTGVTIKGFGGTRTRGVKRGTVRWRWQDDEGTVHSFDIPGSYYVKEAEYRLLSPQHWAKAQGDTTPFGTGCNTDSTHSQLYWNGRKNTLTVPLGTRDNVSTFRLAPGYDDFHAFCAAFDDSDDDPLICMDATTNEAEAHPPTGGETDWKPKSNAPVTTDFSFEGSGEENWSVVQEENEDDGSLTPAAEVLRMHHKFNHIPMAKLQAMARQGVFFMQLYTSVNPERDLRCMWMQTS